MKKPLVKICGIRDINAAKAAAVGADYIGFIINSRYGRYIEPQAVKSICQQLLNVKKVGVFVDQPLAEVADTAIYCGLDFIQLHGYEDTEYIKALQAALHEAGSNIKIIKAFRYGDDFSVQAVNNSPAELVLIDSYSKNQAGGSGKRFAWHKAAKKMQLLTKEYFLAGGIDSENVQEAIELFQPYGIDVSSSLERDRQKQPDLIRDFLIKAGKI